MLTSSLGPRTRGRGITKGVKKGSLLLAEKIGPSGGGHSYVTAEYARERSRACDAAMQLEQNIELNQRFNVAQKPR
jgi:hypothetical protein